MCKKKNSFQFQNYLSEKSKVNNSPSSNREVKNCGTFSRWKKKKKNIYISGQEMNINRLEMEHKASKNSPRILLSVSGK